MGYAAEHLGVSPLDWPKFTVEEAGYIVGYCEDRHTKEVEEAERMKRSR